MQTNLETNQLVQMFKERKETKSKHSFKRNSLDMYCFKETAVSSVSSKSVLRFNVVIKHLRSLLAKDHQNDASALEE